MRMDMPSTPDPKSRFSQAPIVSGNRQQGKSFSLLRWWYQLTSYQEPANATSHEREIARAGRLSSIILLIIFCFGVVLLPGAFRDSSPTLLIIVLVSMVIDVFVVFLNRQGKIMLVGIIMVTVLEIAFIISVLSTSSGLSADLLTTFDLIVLTELIAVSLLPPKSVFLVALCNCLFTWSAITFLPHAPGFPPLTLPAYYDILSRPLILQMIVAVVTYIWAEGATRAILRAEGVAALERSMAEQDRAMAEQKTLLDNGINEILQTHIQIANGDFTARAPLAKDNILWQVASNLNNLLARYQRVAQSHQEMQRTSTEIDNLTRAVRNAKVHHNPVTVAKSGTLLDPLADELTGAYIRRS